MTGESVRRAIRTAVVVTLALWIPGLIGFLNAITEWARAEGATPFPDARGLAYLGVVAIVGGFTGLVQWLWNAIEDATGHGFLRTVPPRQKRGDGGWLRLMMSTGTHPGTVHGPSRDRTLHGKTRVRARRDVR